VRELNEDRPDAATRRSAHAVAVLLLALLFTLLWTSERSRSPTIDEPLHLIRGLAIWSAGDTRLSFAHPPLANALAALPALGDPDVDVEELGGWERANLRAVAEAHFHADYGAAREKLHRARIAIMISSLLLGGILYAWCTTRWGERTGLIALSLYTLHPTLLAHGRLMTTDMPLVLAGFLALIAMIHWVETPGRTPLVLFCAAAALIVGVKHSGGPILALLCGLGSVVA
jgi:hypothetical protein